MMFAAALMFTSCDPIEDKDAHKNFENAGDAITQEALTAALSVRQLENAEGKIEGDQYIIVKNSRPEIGGMWLLKRGEVVVAKSGADVDTLISPSNGEFDLIYQCVSNYKNVTSKVFKITVTNVFDEWDNFLTGAADKADVNAKKVWKFRRLPNGTDFAYGHNGAHGAWKYTSAGYTPESIKGVAWWGEVTDAMMGDNINMRMVFSYSGNKMQIFDKNGNLSQEGTFAYNHESPETGVKGWLNTSIPTMGQQWNECVGSGDPYYCKYYVLTLDENYMSLYNPMAVPGGDWDDCGWYMYFEAVEE